MYLDDFSRAKYTLPNLPRPSGLPISKSTSDQRLDGCIDATTATGQLAMYISQAEPLARYESLTTHPTPTST
jgi:hypothetical protein